MHEIFNIFFKVALAISVIALFFLINQTLPDIDEKSSFSVSLVLYCLPHSFLFLALSLPRSNIADILQQMAELCHPLSHNAQGPHVGVKHRQ